MTLRRHCVLLVSAAALLGCSASTSRAPPPSGAPAPEAEADETEAGEAEPRGAEARLAEARLAEAEAGDAEGHGPEWTKSFRVDDLGKVLTDILRHVDIPALARDIDRIERVAANLEPGDRAIFSFMAWAERDMEVLEVEIRDDFGMYLRVRGEEAPFRLLRELVDEHWRATLLDIAGPIRVSLREVSMPRGSRPRLQLVYRTVRDVGCIPFGFPAEFSRSGDSLRLDLLGLGPRRTQLCAGTGPATGIVELDLASGTYTLVVLNDARADRYRLALTDSTTRLSSVRTSFTMADPRLHLRYPPRSFVLQCRVSALRQPLCDRLNAWVARQRDLSPAAFPATGVVPYPAGSAAHPPHRYFTYTDDAALERLRSCFAGLKSRLEGLKRISIGMATWTGELVSVSGGRLWDTTAGDSAAAYGAVAPCLTSIPPPAADSLSLDLSARSLSGRTYDYGDLWRSATDYWPCEESQETPQNTPRDPTEATVLEDDGDVVILTPMLLPDRWRDAARRAGPPPPPTLAANTSRSAVSRPRFHRDLEIWLCRDGKTIGDAAGHPGASWYWVEDGGDWYFLLPETTAEAVTRYLALVNERGEALGWASLESEEGGPQRVAFGPEHRLIPEFYLYRWRP